MSFCSFVQTVFPFQLEHTTHLRQNNSMSVFGPAIALVRHLVLVVTIHTQRGPSCRKLLREKVRIVSILCNLGLTASYSLSGTTCTLLVAQVIALSSSRTPGPFGKSLQTVVNMEGSVVCNNETHSKWVTFCDARLDMMV